MKVYLLLLALALPLTAQTSPGRQTNQNGQGNNSNNQNAEPPENTSDEENKKRRWHAFLPGGAYHVGLGSITAISKHSYVLDGTLYVSEVTIDTTGNSLARFYFIEPISADSKFNVVQRLQASLGKAQEKAGEYSGTKIDELAQKTYPHTTHAKTIEYRILTEQELGALFGSVYRAWDSGKGRTFRIR